MAPTIPNKDAWTRARDGYIEDLSSEEKALYETASPEAIFYDASAAVKAHTSISSSLKIVDRMSPVVTAIEQYGKALDVYVNAYPLVLSPLWGSIRVVLHLASEFGKYFERIIDMFTRIGDVLPRVHVYENLFPDQERLLQALSVVYMDILTFCTEAKAVFRKERRSLRINIGIVAKLAWKPFERQFGGQMDRFRVHVKNIEKEANLAHMIEASDSRALVRANRKQLEKTRTEDRHRQIIAAIPSIDVFAKHRKLQNLRHEGTGNWIWQNNLYQVWSSSGRSSFLCCSGIPGSGKTILCSSVVDALRSNDAANKSRTVYYYCDYADKRTLQPETILGTILKQFLVNGHLTKELENKFPRGYGEDAPTLMVDDLIDLVCLAIQQSPLVYVILDGLDECDKIARKDVLRFVDRLKAFDASGVKLLISCRQEDQMLRSLQGIPVLHLTTEVLQEDIKVFVAESVSSKIASRELIIQDPKLAEEICDELVKRAHGMFLWVFFQLDDICEAPSDALIRQTLQNLPYGLIETYERILLKIHRDTVKSDLVRRIFMWMVCARRPLKIEEMREAAGFEISQKFWTADVLPDANRIIESCKGLVIWDREDGTTRFAHHTIQQYLLSEPDSPQGLHLKCNKFEAELHVGKMCLTYLNFSDFETQIQTRPSQRPKYKPSDVPQAGPANWIPGMLGVRASKLERPIQFLRLGSSSTSPDIDYAKYLNLNTQTEASNFPTNIGNKYMLLQYVIDNWFLHTRDINISGKSWAQRLQNLAMRKTLPFEFRPWGRNEHHGTYGCGSCKTGNGRLSEADLLPFMSLLHYAAEAGHWPLMEPLITDYCIHEEENDSAERFQWDAKAKKWLLEKSLIDRHRDTHDNNKWTVIIAIRNGHETIVDKLIRRININHSHQGAETRSYWPTLITKLNVAASSGHETIFQSVLRSVKTSDGFLEDEVTNYFHIPLAYAAAHGHLAIVKILLEEGAGLDQKVDVRGETPISAAAANGHEHVVQFLIDIGAQDLRENVTPLHRAAEYGHANLVRVLLGAYFLWETAKSDNIFDPLQPIGALNREGYTPVQLAARNGHANVVHMLVEYAYSAKDKRLLATETSIPRASSREGSALYMAARNGHLAVYQLLYPYVNSEWWQGQDETPLVLAAMGNHIPLVEWLLSDNHVPAHGHAMRPPHGLHPLRVAVAYNHDEVVRMLLDDDYCSTLIEVDVLVTAAKNANDQILEMLISTQRNRQRDIGMVFHNDTIKELLLKAFKQAEEGGYDGAARLLKEYWNQEP